MRFWDASAPIPLCLQERQSAALKRLSLDDESLVVCWGSLVECLSAFARLRREAVLSETEEESPCDSSGAPRICHRGRTNACGA